jgi:hypothetical protein
VFSVNQILKLLLQWIDKYRRKLKRKKEQAERDASNEDPNAWFDDQFNADGRVQQHLTGTDKADTDPDSR